MLGLVFSRPVSASDVFVTPHADHCCTQDASNTRATDSWDESHGSGLWVVGRTTLNLWRIIRGEMKLSIYSFENIMFNVTQKRMPYVHPSVVYKWYTAPVTCWQALRYYGTARVGRACACA